MDLLRSYKTCGDKVEGRGKYCGDPCLKKAQAAQKKAHKAKKKVA